MCACVCTAQTNRRHQIPVTVKLAVVGPPLTSEAAAGTGAGELLQGRRAAGRRLLDTEKLIFTTDAQAAVEVRG